MPKTKEPTKQPHKKPNIRVIWGDDIGISNLSCLNDALAFRP
jgi:hypothetical protein